MFKILNIQSFSYVSQRPVGGIEKHVRTHIVLRSYPFPFQYSPKCFCNVQMWGIWRKEEEEESSVFPYRPEFLYPPVPVHCGIVKHDKGVLADAKGKVIKKTDYLLCRHCRAPSWPASCPLHRPPSHHTPRTLRPIDAALPGHRGAPRLAGHRLVPPLDLWSLWPAKNVHPNTISKIRRDITFDK